MKKVSRVIIGGTLIALGCGCFLYPNFREWNTQREVESVIHKFDETYSKGIDSDITSEPVKTSDKSDSDKNDTADVTGQPASTHFTSGGIAIHSTDGLILFNINPNSVISVFK